MGTQRRKKGDLTPDQLKRLNKLGFIWDARGELWERNFAALQKFHQSEGHCRVPRGHEKDGLNLGNWVGNTSRNKKNLTTDQIKRLNALGFVWKA